MQWVKYLQCGRHICSGAFASNVKCMYSSAFGHTVDMHTNTNEYTPKCLASYMHTSIQTYIDTGV